MRKLKLLSVLILLFSWGIAGAQPEDKSNRPSPPRTSETSMNGNAIVIDYSSPAVKNRAIWGDLVPYGKVWRTGANEATTISFQDSVTIGDQRVSPGKYALFTIPNEKEWTIILNAVWDQWGSYNYDESKDVIRFTAKSNKTKEIAERFEIEVNKIGEVVIRWEYLEVEFPIE